jgi:hypothetical protein
VAHKDADTNRLPSSSSKNVRSLVCH